MKIKIYQINMERDNEGYAFMSMDFVNQKLGLDHPASEIYEQVYATYSQPLSSKDTLLS